MRVEMNSADSELLTVAFEGKPAPPAVLQLYKRIKRRRLLMGDAGPFSKEVLAMLCEMAGATSGAEALEDFEAPAAEPANGQAGEDLYHTRVADDPSKVEFESSAGPDRYRGPQQRVESPFTSKPGDPWTKVEKNRPLTYISPRDRSRRSGRFVKIKDSKHIIIRSSEMRRNFSVPTETAELTNLDPIPSTPRPVQI